MPLLSADGMWLSPQWDAVSPPARGSYPQYSSHCSICCLLREQTGFRSHVLNGLIKTIAVALEENCHVLVQNHRLTASLLFTCLQCHSQDPSCFWAAKAKKKKKICNPKDKEQEQGMVQPGATAGKRTRASLLPAKAIRQVGQETAVTGNGHYPQQ